MRPISKRVKKLLEGDKRMEKCEICGSNQVVWHHVFIYSGRQIDEYFNIAPACEHHHAQATPHNNKYKQEIREKFEWNALQRMTGDDLKKYWKADWGTMTWYLSKQAEKYGW